MRGRAALRPVSLTARVNRLERDLQPRESWASRESRAQLTRWLVEVDEAAELYDDYIYYQDTLGTTGVLASPAGREALLAMIESLYSFEAP